MKTACPAPQAIKVLRKDRNRAGVLVQEQESEYNRVCQSFGLKVGTSEYFKCREQMLARVTEVNAEQE